MWFSLKSKAPILFILGAIVSLQTSCFPMRAQEERYQSAIFAVALVSKYYSINNSLPTGWGELEKVEIESGNGFFTWPSGRTFVEERVGIDFSMSIQSVIETPADYIKTRGSTYSFHSEVLGFVDRLKKYRETK